MPVLSPHRSSASALAGSYRSTFSSSTIDKPYFSSTSYNPRITTYSERYTARSYADSDGRRIFSRSGSITEDGITSRFREETRDPSTRRDSLSRDSGIGSIRENSIVSDFPRRDSSLSRGGDGSRLSAVNVLDSVAELRSKYSPANYVPACLRQGGRGGGDIGLPPLETRANKKKVNDCLLNYNNGVNSNTTNDNAIKSDDDNGNRASVADLCKKFDENKQVVGGKSARNQPPIEIEGTSVKIAENRFKKLDTSATEAATKAKGNKIAKKIEKSSGLKSKFASEENCHQHQSDSEIGAVSKLDVNESTIVLQNGAREKDEEESNEVNRKGASRVNNFASYIPSKDYQQKGDSVKNNGEDTSVEEEESKTDLVNGKRFTDLSTSPKLSVSSRSAVSPSSTSTLTTNSSSSLRRSTDRESYDKYSSPTKTLGLNGLKNIGNTCFMNSVIQCLSNTRHLLEYLLKDLYVNDINTTTSGMKGALIKSFAEVIKELWSEDASDRVVNTTSLKSQIQRFAPRFIGYAQQDAQEFLRYLLEGLHEDVNRVKEKPKPILTEIDEKLSDSEKSSESWSRYLRMDNSRIVDYFVGQLKSTLKCTHCGHCSVTFDPFWDLSLPIPQRAGQVRLSQCLESFTREETLDGDEKPTCSKCKERRKCTKSFTIQKFPRILVIHLKRFSLAERFRGKLSVTVDFPLEGLDMSHYAADHVTPCRYNLYAISNHSGTTYSGHYTAYCRHPYTKSWHEYNDSRVSSISSKSIVSGEAYVLFYEQEGQKSHL